ncbi:hypothetical protein BGZ74_004264, partial [Mortierella antarctica]
FVWLPMDFDNTFSRNIESYKKIPRKNKKGFESYLVSKLILDTPVNAKFEDHEDVAWDRKLLRVAKGGKSYNYKLEDLYKGVQHDLKGWIKKRSAQVQKDMNFKSLTVVTNRVPPHNMHPMQLSVYGIKPQPVAPKNIKVPAPAPVAHAVPVPIATQDSEDPEDKKEQPAAAVTEEQISNSASMAGRHWATLGALVAAIVLVA